MFSDGTFIPKGTMIGVATRCVHHDEKVYENAHSFEPFRFAEMQKEDRAGGKYLLVSTAVEYQPFGHGKHAWYGVSVFLCRRLEIRLLDSPGRFFAGSVMKSMLAHIVTTYDIKLEDAAIRPPSLRFGTAITPDPRAKVLFRRRVY